MTGPTKCVPGVVFLAAYLGLAASETTALAAPQAPEPSAEPAPEKLVETRHTITVAGAKLDYQATAGYLVLKDENAKPTANLFFIAYTKIGVEEPARRPITFTFNGGPGSSSVWLHLGAFGPRRVLVGDVGEPASPPYHLVDNEATLLDVTDLVFIDPVSTGYSRPAPGKDAKQFHGVQEDFQSIGEFIRMYVTRFNRWTSPKFVAGESYGTTRAAALVAHLQDHLGIRCNGIILLSTILNFETISFDEGNDLPYILFLPSYTAAAWYHKKLPPDLQNDRRKALVEVERFALGDYTLALMKGVRLSGEDQKAIALKLARYTGLSEEYIVRSNLRIESTRFMKELLRGQQQTIGRFDARFVGSDLDAVSDQSDYDPSLTEVWGTYTALLNQYVRTELKYERDTPYEILNTRVQPWDYGNAKNRYLNVTESLRRAMTKNRDLRVFVGCGWYDLATPYAATLYTFNHLGPSAELLEHVTTADYEAGHMMYVHKPSLQKLKRDLAAFVQAAVAR